MRILVVNWKCPSHPAAGGAEVYTDRITRHWVARGHEVTWLTSRPSGLAAREVMSGVEIVRRGSRASVYPRARAWWHGEGRRRGFDVVVDEVNTRPFFTHAWPDAPPSTVLVHQTAEDILDAELPAPLAALGRTLERRWLRRLRGQDVVTVSGSSRDALARLGLPGARVLPQGTDPRPVPEALPDTSGPTLAWIARLAPVKQPLAVLDAFRRLRRQMPEAQLWLMGDGPLRSEVAAATSGMDGVHVLGRVSDAERDARIAAADLLLVTSIREGWCLTVSEAALLGTPTVAYRAPGLVDSVPASGGALCDPEPQALADLAAQVLRGERALTPRRSTIPFEDLADLWLDHLRHVVERGRAN